jgi:hypothetical protein
MFKLSQDGRTVASRDHDNEVTVRDIVTGKTLCVLKQAPTVAGLMFLSPGKALVTAGMDGVVRLWEIPSGRLVREWREPGFHELRALTVSDSGNAVAASFDQGPTVVWDSAGGGVLAKLPCDSRFSLLRITPNGGSVACKETYGMIYDVGAAHNPRIAELFDLGGAAFSRDSNTGGRGSRAELCLYLERADGQATAPPSGGSLRTGSILQ